MIELEDVTDDQQERMCELCEHHIICGSSNTYHFQCEGRYCEQALDLLIEEMDEKVEPLEEYVKEQKIKKVAEFEKYKYILIT